MMLFPRVRQVSFVLRFWEDTDMISWYVEWASGESPEDLSDDCSHDEWNHSAEKSAEMLGRFVKAVQIVTPLHCEPFPLDCDQVREKLLEALYF